LKAQPDDIRAQFDRLREIVMEHGVTHLPPKYVKHIERRLWELRLRGKDGIARALYVTAAGCVWSSYGFSQRRSRRRRRGKIGWP
jgi:hypothetical protein